MTEKDKLNRFARAANALRTASEVLGQIQDAGGFYSADAGYYKDKVDELLSCDNGEAGIDTIIAEFVDHLKPWGEASEAAAILGSRTSERKSAISAANGRKGGRLRKE